MVDSSLDEARQNIDRINDEIVEKVDERMSEVLRIVKYKDENDMDVKDEDRENAVVRQFADRFEEKELPRERGRQLGRLLIDTAVDLERDMLGKKEQ
jgi:chorismate mutase